MLRGGFETLVDDNMLPNHPIVNHLWPLELRATTEQRFESAAKAYEEGTGEVLGRPISIEDRRLIAQWLDNEEWNTPTSDSGHSYPLLSRRFPIAYPVIETTLASKVVRLGQYHCFDCVTPPSAPGAVSFPIRVRPFSAQSTESDRLQRTKQAVAEYLTTRNLVDLEAWGEFEVCVSIVAVVPEASRRKDVDNLAKGILDAMQGSVYTNDRMVQHLNIRRVEHAGDLSCYSIMAKPVMDPRTDVLDDRLNLGLLSALIDIG